MTPKQIENARLAYQLIAGIPAKRMNLNLPRATANDMIDKVLPTDDQLKHTCGSVACIAGWLSLHPHFQKQGLTHLNIDVASRMGWHDHMDDLSQKLFGNPDVFDASKCDAVTGAEHKVEALRRIRQLLYIDDAISDTRDDELIAYERALLYSGGV